MGSNEAHRTLSAAAVASVLCLGLVLSATLVRNYDIHWHLKAGEWIVQHWQVPHQDFFSFSREGQEWIDAQWLFQVAAFGFHLAAGDAGLTLMIMVLAAALMLLGPLSAPGLPRELRALCGLVFILAINPRLMCRPELLSCLYMSGLFFVFERALRGRTRLLFIAPLIQLLFANSEGVWPVGLAIAGTFMIDAVYGLIKSPGGLSGNKGEALRWVAVFAICVAVSAIQPYGLKGFLFPLDLLGEIALKSTIQKKLVLEIQPLFADPWLPRAFMPFLVMAGLSLFLGTAAGRRIRPALFILGIIFTWFAVSARRNLSFAGVVLIHVLAVHLEMIVRNRADRPFFPVLLRWSAVTSLAAGLFLSVFSLSRPVRTWDQSYREPGLGISEDSYPVQAVAFLKSIGFKGNIINSEKVGGYLIWTGWPEWKVFSDTRMEVGGEGAILFFLAVFNDMRVLEEVAQKEKVGAVVIRIRQPYTDFFLRFLKENNWALVHLDSGSAVFLRRGPEWDEVIARDEIKDPMSHPISIPKR